MSAALLPAAAYEPTSFEVTASSAMLVSLDGGGVLYAKNIDERVYPASITKIMTAVVALENIDDLDNTVMTVSQNAIDLLYGTDSSTFGLVAGEELSARDMLYILLIHSANEAANVIAEHVGGSIQSFVDMMNDKAAELGMENTHFMNPHGLHSSEHYTTVSDLYKLVKYAMDIPVFMDICTTNAYTLAPTNKCAKERTITSTNLLMQASSGYYYQYASGIKTGYTDQAGRCLVSTASKNGYSYLSIVMNCPVKNDKGQNIRDDMTVTANLFKWAFSDFEYRRVLDSAEPIGEIEVEYAWSTDHLQLYPQSDCYALIPSAADISTVKTEVTTDSEKAAAPVEKGDVLGRCDIYLAEEKIAEVPLVAGDSVKKSTVLYILSCIKEVTALTWFRVLAVIIIFLVLCFAVLRSVQRSRRRRAMQRQRMRRRNESNHTDRRM